MRSLLLIASFLLGAGCVPVGAAPSIKRVVGSNDVPPGETIFSPMTDRAGISASGDVLLAIDTAGAKRGAYRWSQSQGTIIPILVTGEPAPGLPGETLRVLTPPGYMDQNGNVTVGFNYTTGAFSRKSGIWSGSAADPPTIQLLAADDHAPFFSILPPRVSQEGTLALVGTVRFENGLTAKSMFRGAAGELPQALLTGGDAIPVALGEEDPNKNVADIRDVAVDNNGRISCILSRRQLGDFGMILAYGSGTWSEVARLFTPAAGTEHDFRRFDALSVANDTVVFTGTTTKGPSGQPGIWRAAGDGTTDLIAVAEEPFGDALGSTVPGIPGGTLFDIRLPLVADTGASYFSAALVVGDGIDVSNNDLILRHDDTGMRVVIREGDPAPGLPSGEGWRIPQLPGRFAISPDGRLAMIADAQNAEGAQEKWLWVSGVDGAFEPIMKVGDAVKGVPIANIEMFVGFNGDGGNPIGRSGADGMTGPFNARGELVVGITHPDERVIYILDFVNLAPPKLVLTVPADATVECDAVPAVGTPTATDDCGTPTITYDGETSSGTSCPEILTRTWTATDACGSTHTVSQTITVVDTTNPVLTVPADATVECDAVPAVGTPTATDNCGTPTITYDGETSSGTSCPEILTRTWTATDACGNEHTVSQTITVIDTTNPVLTVPADATVECDAVPAVGTPTATDNCGTPTITYDGETSSGTSCPEILTRTWTATDACGNKHTVSQTITVVDTTNPVPIQLSTPFLAEGKIHFSFSSEEGKQYRLEGSNTLTEWEPVGEIVIGSGGDEEISEPVQDRAFYYRVVGINQ